MAHFSDIFMLLLSHNSIFLSAFVGKTESLGSDTPSHPHVGWPRVGTPKLLSRCQVALGLCIPLLDGLGSTP